MDTSLYPALGKELARKRAQLAPDEATDQRLAVTSESCRRY